MLVWTRFVPHTVKRSRDGTREQVRERFAVVLPSGRVKYLKRTHMRRVVESAAVVEAQPSQVVVKPLLGSLRPSMVAQLKRKIAEMVRSE